MILTKEQLTALRAYAASHGRTWKSQLNHMWMTGQYDADDNSSALQQIRNTFGPSWLVRFRLSPPKSLGECCCSDPGCPKHKGRSGCSYIATSIVYRIDMEDKTGTPMCSGCTEDALNSGVFTCSEVK